MVYSLPIVGGMVIRIILPILRKGAKITQTNAEHYTRYDTKKTEPKWGQGGITPTNSFGSLVMDLFTFGCWSGYWNIQKILNRYV